MPRRAYSADVIGASLLAAAHGTSRATTAAGLGVPAGTLRNWLRAARRGATALVARAAQTATHLGVSVYDHRSTGSWLGSALTEALDAIGVAARALARSTTLAPAVMSLRGRRAAVGRATRRRPTLSGVPSWSVPHRGSSSSSSAMAGQCGRLTLLHP
ncbi:hypothetical protein [Streptomyces sp. NPDC058572]|uniref:hypothetical protein n=1 Tax=Streptomyces sp. NPDC058572 TaxID=3346546 RepID=UPI003647B20C